MEKNKPEPRVSNTSPSDNADVASNRSTKSSFSRKRKKHYSAEDGLRPLWAQRSVGLRIAQGFKMLGYWE